jgi:hypothetical protein
MIRTHTICENCHQREPLAPGEDTTNGLGFVAAHVIDQRRLCAGDTMPDMLEGDPCVERRADDLAPYVFAEQVANLEQLLDDLEAEPVWTQGSRWLDAEGKPL